MLKSIIISTIKNNSIMVWNYFNDIKIEELVVFNINNILITAKYIKILQENLFSSIERDNKRIYIST